jgi:PHD/YefM family antitoxin component YafN of YafNO toxin-antitoxin module
MANNFLSKTKKIMDPKKRAGLAIFIVLVVLLVLFAVFRTWKSNAQSPGGSSLSSGPSISSVQGGKVSPEYRRALQSTNKYNVNVAKNTGGSSVGTLIDTGEQISTGCSDCCAGCGEETLKQALEKLVREGIISPALQKELNKLAAENVSEAEFAKKLQKTVQEKKLTPEEARHLLSAYKKLYKEGLQKLGAKEMDQLIKNGEVPLDVADDLLNLQAGNPSVQTYAARLAELVKEGKLSPAAAAKLLAQYKKLHQDRLNKETKGQLEGMVATDGMDHSVAATLAALQDTGVSVGSYANALERLVKEGKLTPAQAARLLAQYKKKMGVSTSDASVSAYNSSMKLPEKEKAKLKELQGNNVSVSAYATSLQGMVSGNIISTTTASAVLTAYQAEVKAKHATIAQLKQLASQKVITSATAKKLVGLQIKHATFPAYSKVVNEDVAANSIPPVLKSKILTSYQAGLIAARNKDQLLNQLGSQRRLSNTAAASLSKLQSQQASAASYAGQLKYLATAGEVSPKTASELLKAYKEKLAAEEAANSATDQLNNNIGVGSSGAFADTGDPSLNRIQQEVAEQQAHSKKLKDMEYQQKILEGKKVEASEQAVATQKTLSEMSQKMLTQATQLVTTNWSPVPQTLVAGEASSDKGGAAGSPEAAAGKDSSGKKKDSGPPLIKAGDIMYAVLDTAVNSDYPSSPTMATIVSGKYKGAKLLGTISTSSGSGKDRVMLKFTTLTMTSWPTGLAVDAYAIDPDTAKTAIATSVNHHYMMKYGALFASSFLSGFGQAISDSGSSTSSSDGVTTSSTSEFSTSDEVLIGIGAIGQSMSANLSKMENIPPTVKVKAGVGLGVLFMNDVSSSGTSSWSSGSSSKSGSKSSAASGGSDGSS